MTTAAIPAKSFRINQFIRITPVVVIDEVGKPLGEMATSAALTLAQSRGLDLVEVAPMARPPVCKILDFGAYQFRQEKQERKAKAHQKKVELKGIRLTFKIGQHDKATRQAKALDFLNDGHKVQIEMRLRGRENAHAALAKQNVRDFIAMLGDDIVVEQQVTQLGNRLYATVGRKK